METSAGTKQVWSVRDERLSTHGRLEGEPQAGSGAERSVVWNFKFAATALLGTLAVSLVCTFSAPPGQLAVLGSLISILAGLFLAYVEQEDLRDRRRNAILSRLAVPIALAPEHEFFDQYSAFSTTLGELTCQTDPVLRDFALLKLSAVSDELRHLAQGKVVFSSTETWRVVYEKLLSAPLGRYCSVAWVKTKDYWQNAPGRASMELNYKFVAAGNELRRVVIVRDRLWPSGDALPSSDILPWLIDQHEHGIRLSLVRESDLLAEEELLADFGIYGDRATGVQEIDDQCRTIRFTLRFDKESLKLARNRFARVALYATPFTPPKPAGKQK